MAPSNLAERREGGEGEFGGHHYLSLVGYKTVGERLRRFDLSGGRRPGGAPPERDETARFC